MTTKEYLEEENEEEEVKEEGEEVMGEEEVGEKDKEGEEKKEGKEDIRADYPKVQYDYKFVEVAFLFHKLKQFGHKFKDSKRTCLSRRDKELNKTSEKLEAELKKVLGDNHVIIKTLEGGRWQKLFDLHSKDFDLRRTYQHKELEEMRKEMIKKFNIFCSEEVSNIYGIIDSFKLRLEASISEFDNIRHDVKQPDGLNTPLEPSLARTKDSLKCDTCRTEFETVDQFNDHYSAQFCCHECGICYKTKEAAHLHELEFHPNTHNASTYIPLETQLLFASNQSRKP